MAVGSALLLVLAILTISEVKSFGSIEELINGYARTKLWENCVGDSLAKDWEKRVDEVALQCRREIPKPEASSELFGRGLSNEIINNSNFRKRRVEPQHRIPNHRRNHNMRNDHINSGVFVTKRPQHSFASNHWFNLPLAANRRNDVVPNSNQRRNDVINNPNHRRNFVSPNRRSNVIPNTSQLLRHQNDQQDDRQLVWFTLFDQIPIIVQPSSSPQSGVKSRQKRSSDRAQFEVFLQNMVDSERAVRERLANFTCVLQTLGLVDNRGDLKYETMESSTRNSDLDVELKNDFLGVLDDCTRLSRCESYKSHVVPVNLQRAFSFLRCARDRRQIACLKRDLRSYLRVNLYNNTASHTVDLEDMVDRIFYVTMAEMGHREVKNMLLV